MGLKSLTCFHPKAKAAWLSTARTRVDVCLSGIGRNPLAYQVIEQQVRKALIRRFPYIILYICERDTIVVIPCFHAKRDPKNWLDRI